MMPNPTYTTFSLIKGALTPINHISMSMLEQAYLLTKNGMSEMQLNVEEYQSLYASNILATARNYFKNTNIKEWKLSPRTNCFHLAHEDTGLHVRFLHGFRGKNEVPPAGSNKKRQADWYQAALIPDDTVLGDLPLDGTTIVVIWTENNGQFEVNAYHPVDASKFPHPAKVDMCIHLGVPDSEYMETLTMSVHLDEESANIIPLVSAVEQIDTQALSLKSYE